MPPQTRACPCILLRAVNDGPLPKETISKLSVSQPTQSFDLLTSSTRRENLAAMEPITLRESEQSYTATFVAAGAGACPRPM